MLHLAEINFENSFLYFYSATPQVLGALVGLLGVFLLFKFQSISKSIIGFGEQILNHLNNEPFLAGLNDRQIRLLKGHLQDGLLRNDLETVVSQIAGINSRLEGIKNETNFTSHKDQNTENERNGLLKTFQICENIQWTCLEFKYNLTQDSKRLLIHSIGVIISSLACIPFVPILSCNNRIVLFLISFLVLLWFGKCLINIIWLVIVSLAHDYNDELMPNKKGFFSEAKKIFKQSKRIKYKRQWD